jgi:hypothetical protein
VLQPGNSHGCAGNRGSRPEQIRAFYTAAPSRDELAHLLADAGVATLDAEIACARIALHRVLTGLLDLFFAMTFYRKPRTEYLPGECGPVCYGETPCNVREVKRRRWVGVPSVRSEPQKVSIAQPVPDDDRLEAVQLRVLAVAKAGHALQVSTAP